MYARSSIIQINGHKSVTSRAEVLRPAGTPYLIMTPLPPEISKGLITANMTSLKVVFKTLNICLSVHNIFLL